MIEADRRTAVRLDIDRSFYKELRKILFRNGVSLQEFFSHITRAIVLGDATACLILEEAKKGLSVTEDYNIRHTDVESLYNLIEGTSPFAKED